METLRSMLPLVIEHGIATAEEVEVDTLADRLGDEAEETGSVIKAPDAVSAWSRRR